VVNFCAKLLNIANKYAYYIAATSLKINKNNNSNNMEIYSAL